MDGTEGVYLLHFDRPIGNLSNPRAQARHYLGWAHDVGARLREHEQGTGAALTRAVSQAGIGWRLACVWVGLGRKHERALKNRKKAAELCPLCRR